MNYSRFQEPDYKADKLADTLFWFEDVAPIDGMRLDGCADVRVDSTGDWYFHSFEIGAWRTRLYSGPKFIGKTIEFLNPKDGGTFEQMYELICNALRKNYDSEITDECREAGRSS